MGGLNTALYFICIMIGFWNRIRIMSSIPGDHFQSFHIKDLNKYFICTDQPVLLKRVSVCNTSFTNSLKGKIKNQPCLPEYYCNGPLSANISVEGIFANHRLLASTKYFQLSSLTSIKSNCPKRFLSISCSGKSCM